jgi:hypothetical protein
MRNVLATEYIKYRKSHFWFLVILGPIILALGEFAGLNYYSNSHTIKLETIFGINLQILKYILNFFMVFIIASVNNVEYKNSTWKRTFTYPVQKFSVYINKFLVVMVALIITTVIHMICTLLLLPGLGISLDTVSMQHMFVFTLYPFLISIPFCALAFIISINVSNQSVIVALALASYLFGDILSSTKLWWFPISYQILYFPINFVNNLDVFNTLWSYDKWYMLAGIPITIIILGIGYILFIKMNNKN